LRKPTETLSVSGDGSGVSEGVSEGDGEGLPEGEAAGEGVLSPPGVPAQAAREKSRRQASSKEMIFFM